MKRPSTNELVDRMCKGYRADKLAKYAIAQQKLHREQLGFLSRVAIETYAERGQIIPAVDNGDFVSYALFYDGVNGNTPKREPTILRIHQICTQYDARMLQHATHLVNRLIDIAAAKGLTKLRAWVADDIPANDFWTTIGFEIVATRVGGHTRERLHNCYMLDIGETTASTITPQ